MRVLIHNAEIITMNGSNDIVYGDILIEDDRIAAIGQLRNPQVDKIIDATQLTVLPGFVQTHVHLSQTLFRGRADDLELLDWLKLRIWPLEAAHDSESVYYSALLGIGELIRSGTTTIVDMETVHHTDFAFQAIEQSGIRALSGKVMMDFGDDVPSGLLERTEESVRESVDLLEKWHQRDKGRIRYAFSPRFVVSCTEDLLIQVRDLSKQYRVHVHTHASENQGEIALVERQRGKRNIVYLDHLGLTSERLILAHCVWLDQQERDIIQNRGVKVSHCPSSNLKLSSGIAEIPRLLQHQCHVGIGADGAPCSNNLDMFHEMRLAALIQKPGHGPTAMPASTVLRMATMGGAEVIGQQDEIGSLEVGKKADIIILNLNDFHVYPSFDTDPVSRVVYSATRADVVTTIINGKIVMEDRKLMTVDPDIVLREANRSIARVLERL